MNDKGVALPVALIVMAVLVSLIVAFLVLASTEPQIASNQKVGAQARALAETGIERALWALTKGDTTPGFSGALNPANTNPSAAPYNGGTFVQVSNLGQFSVTVADGAGANEKVVTAVGWVPSNTNPMQSRRSR
jgi:Tfp pilus assembly protein PilX